MSDANELFELSSGIETSSDSSSEDEIDEVIGNAKIPKEPRKRVFFQRKHPMLEYDESDFIKRYRLPKSAIMELTSILNNRLAYLHNKNDPVPVLDMVIMTLRYYATGTMQMVIGDLSGIHQVSVGRIVKRTTIALAEKAREWIQMPTTAEEIQKVKSDFREEYELPNVVGIIDGTHIPILSPGGDNAEQYRGRKSFFSINVQGVIDANLKFTDIVAR